MHYCRQFVHRSRARLYCTEPSKTLYPKGICNYDRTLWRWQCSTTMTHFPWAWQTLSPLSGVQEKGRTEVKPNPIKCLFKYNDRLTRKVESALDSQVPMYTIVVMKSSLTHRTSGWPESHSSMCTESILQPPPPFKCLHIQGRVIYSKGPSHIWWCMTVFHFYSCRMTLCGWLWRLDGAVRVWQRGGGAESGAREEWLCGTATDRQMGMGGVEGLKVQGTETKEWSYWWLKEGCTLNSSTLIQKRIGGVKVWTDR